MTYEVMTLMSKQEEKVEEVEEKEYEDIPIRRSLRIKRREEQREGGEGEEEEKKKKEEKKEYTSLFHFHIVHLFFSLPAVLWRRKILKHVQKKHPTSSTPPSTESFDDKEYS